VTIDMLKEWTVRHTLPRMSLVTHFQVQHHHNAGSRASRCLITPPFTCPKYVSNMGGGPICGNH